METKTAFKAFDKNLKCRGFQYEIGKEYKHEGKVEVCESGFHSCENPLDVLNYYDLTESRFAEVECSGDIKTHLDDSKIASKKIKIKAELKLGEFIKASIDYLFKSGNKDERTQAASGDSAQLAASGVYAKLAASGDYAKLAASGVYAKLAASGDSAKLAASGDYAKLAASGDSAQLAASGVYAQLAASGVYAKLAASGDSAKLAASGVYAQLAASGVYAQLAASGDYAKLDIQGTASVGSAIGYNSIIKGINGTLICLVEYDKDYKPIGFVTGKIGENGLKENTFYKAINGKFEEA